MKKRSKPHQLDTPVLTVPEASVLVKLSRSTLYRAMDKKQLRFLKYGTSRRITREDLNLFIVSLRAG